MGLRIVIATSDIFVRRLVPALTQFVPAQFDFRIVDINRRSAEIVRQIQALEPDGVVTESLPKLTDKIIEMKLPTVVVDSDITFPGVVSLDVDDAAVGRVAAEFFQTSGYRNFACVHNLTPYSFQRLAGFQQALPGKAVAEFVQPERRPRNYMESWNEPLHSLRQWLKQLPKPVGVFAVHDPLGRLILDAAAEEGIRVPEDLAVIGANNDELVCGLSYPPLSSVHIPWERIGTIATEWVHRLIMGAEPRSEPIIVQPGAVIVRHSTALAAVEDTDVQRVLKYFRNHLRSDISIASACAALSLSRRVVERKFVRYLHASPWEQLNSLRVDMAKTALVSSTRPIAFIAEEAGFPNAERFSVIFKKHTGISPRAFRKQAGGE